VIPIIRRKALSQGSVTGKVESGLYRILNDRHLNVAAASDANDVSPITGISYGRVPDHKVSTYIVFRVFKTGLSYPSYLVGHNVAAKWQISNPKPWIRCCICWLEQLATTAAWG
jgi:hypothetical protein